MFPLDLQGRSLNPVSILKSAESLAKPGAVTVHDTYSLSDEVLVTISSSGYKVRAIIPESFGFGLTNKWSSALGSLSDTKNFATLDEALKLLTGRSFAGNPLFSRATYKGTEPITIPLKLNFVSALDPENEVFVPVANLFAMASPTLTNRDNKFSSVTIPGPLTFPEITDKLKFSNLVERPVTIQFGTLFKFTRCYIKTINVTFESYMINGYPMSATVDMSLGTQEGSATINLLSIAKELKNKPELSDEDKKRLGLANFRKQILGIS